ncbi:hypothetical protein HY224_02485 [Candidatus Uhrbacteria bacterium]|nr:hypothetical protein [Candidatus Uhrbacteria bacterium]
MINIKFFNDLLTQYTQYNSRRHELIKLASDALRLSKQAIFALHRSDKDQAAELLKQAEAAFGKLSELIKKDADLRAEGSYLAAIEEYVEAKFFYQYLAGEQIDYLQSEFTIGYDEYLSGICDLTGELTRTAVILAGRGKFKEVMEIQQTVEAIVAEIIKFDLVGQLRVKYDDAKRNLKRLEEIAYDLQIRGHK